VRPPSRATTEPRPWRGQVLVISRGGMGGSSSGPGNGAPGVSIFTTLRFEYQQPQVGQENMAQVADVRMFTPGMTAFVEGLGYHQAATVLEVLSGVMRRTLGTPGTAPPLTTAPIGSRVQVTGQPGPAGADGADGADGVNAYTELRTDFLTSFP